MEFKVRIPFVDLLGFELVSWDGGQAELALNLRDELTNSWGVAHGGVSMTLLDVVMALAARSPNQPGIEESPGVVTIEMKTTFMRPGMGRLVCKAKLLHRTASMAFCEASLFDQDGLLAAQATGTFKYLRGLAAGGQRIQRPNASD